MTVRTKQLFCGRTGAASATSVLYTVPSGETAILKDLQVFNRSGLAADVRFGIDPAGAIGPTILLQHLASPAGFWVHYTLWWVLNPGDALVFGSVGAGTGVDSLFALCSGSLLDGVSP